MDKLEDLLRANIAANMKRTRAEMDAYQANARASQYAQNAAQQWMITGGLGMYQSQQGVMQGVKAMQEKAPKFDPNTSPAYQMELSALCDLWRAKYGDKWVEHLNRYNTVDERFWADATERLGAAGMLEMCRGWLRLKEL